MYRNAQIVSYGYTTGQKGLKGHVYSHRIDTPTIIQQLPLSAMKVPLRVTMTGAYTSAERARLLKQYEVDRAKVFALLCWFKFHHPAYADINIDTAALAALPVMRGVLDGVVDVCDESMLDDGDNSCMPRPRPPPSALGDSKASMLDLSSSSDDDSESDRGDGSGSGNDSLSDGERRTTAAAAAAVTGIDSKADVKSVSDDGRIEMGYTIRIPRDGESNPSRTAAALREMVRDGQIEQQLDIKASNVPAYDSDKSTLVKAWARLFPFGRGGFTDPAREVEVSVEDCIKHYLRISTCQFHGSDFTLHMYDLKARKLIAHKSLIISKARWAANTAAAIERNESAPPMDHKSSLGSVSHSGLRNAIEYQDAVAGASKSNLPVPPVPPTLDVQSQEFIRHVQRVAGDAEHSKERAIRARSQIFAMNYRFGAPTWWYVWCFSRRIR